MKLFFLIGIFGCLLQAEVWAQTYTPPKISSKTQKEYDSAMYAGTSGQYETAITQLQQLIAKNPHWLLPRESLSKFYFEKGRIHDAIETIQQSLAIDTNSQTHILLTLGKLQETANRWNEAKESYKAIIRSKTAYTSLKEKAQKQLDLLEDKSNLIDSVDSFHFTPLSTHINTTDHEYLGRWTLNGKQLIFTRRTGKQEDLMIASQSENGTFDKVIAWEFNTEQNEAAHAISPDGRMLVFTGCNLPDSRGSCDLYISYLKDGAWIKPVNIGSPINTAAWESQPCFGMDGKSIYFSSNRSGGYGGRDIWYSRLQENGKWSTPVNAGPGINTIDNEESPFVHFDEQRIYFMRDGNFGIGGYDLYTSKKTVKGKWEKALNMGRPINTGRDEGALAVHPDGKLAIITRFVDGQYNDLFTFTLPEKFRATPLQALEVKMIDEITLQPVKGYLEVFEIEDFDTVRTSLQSNDAGEITLALKVDRSYGALAYSEGYMVRSVHLIGDTSSARQISILMKSVKNAEEEVIRLENIHFKTGEATLLPSSAPELNSMADLFLKNPHWKFEIAGHTDNVGDAEANLILSEKRAESVKQYLIQKGISEERMKAIGYGEAKPIDTNDTPEGRRKNRRTEISIILP